MSTLSEQQLYDLDRKHVWHPYAALNSDAPMFAVDSAQGVRLKLKDGRELIDGMSSWWSTLHGYNHPELNKALVEQSQRMAHVMFGGLTHEPAVKLAKQLVDISPAPLEHVFFSDSGSVAVEVAMKMAIQYWASRGQQRSRFLTFKRGYHGDTFMAMSVCDPVTGMHSLFSDAIQQQLFAEAPRLRIDDIWHDSESSELKQLLHKHHRELAGVIVEPIVQGTGGMFFYHANYLSTLRELCDNYDLPLIFDEIATGLGRTGKLFACEHAALAPDIMCLGKTLSAGYITLAATLCSSNIAMQIQDGPASVFMHGPTFMANPLACAVAGRSIELLHENNWQQQVQSIELALKKGLAPCKTLEAVADVRVLGAIGVVEMKETVDLRRLQPIFVEHGIWLRPFGKLVYCMPPYISTDDDLSKLCNALYLSLEKVYCAS
ncbi:adenosylmethionine--8-amino-7-oxononanoate transaminase [Agaribacterium haliotis]|uniref:adenosylmethionine--8-amino-7-oxononanoate transaminase n=1 Tax=Agaribacterium haliotis TaxID=2013869 RepID=UPI000BB594C9|nr:adenosylmethionine--8-amino-7-oxononanoate transaminase [Agaribacterium haliotis]